MKIQDTTSGMLYYKHKIQGNSRKDITYNMYPDNNTPQPPQPGQPNQSSGGYPPQQPQGYDPTAVPPGQPAPPQPPVPAPTWQPPAGQQQPPYQAPASAPYGAPVDPTAQLPQPQGLPSVPQYDPNKGKAAKKVVIILVVLVVLGGLAAGGYYLSTMLGKKADSNKTHTAIDKSKSQSEAQPLEELEGVTLVPPNDLTKYTANEANTSTVMSYTTADGLCSLQIGVYDEVALPGADLAGIVAKQLDAFRAQGVTIAAPVSGSPLELKDATDGSKLYSLPSLTFTASQENVHVRSHYSATVLADNKRAFVTRVCKSTTGEVPESALKQLDADAATITVKS